MTVKELVDEINLCLENTENLLDRTKKLVGNFNDASISIGLYSHAIEEFGKASLLND